MDEVKRRKRAGLRRDPRPYFLDPSSLSENGRELVTTLMREMDVREASVIYRAGGDPVYTIAVADLHDERAVNAASWALRRPAAVMLVCPREAADDIRGWAESVSENVR